MSRKLKKTIQPPSHQLPQETKEETIRVPKQAPESKSVTYQQYSEHYEGPLPPPALLRQYGEIIPDGPNRIFNLLETQTAHRISMERTVILGDNNRANWGLICGAFLTICFLATGGFLIYEGHDWAGATIITANVVGLISVFIYGTTIRRKEREAKKATSKA